MWTYPDGTKHPVLPPYVVEGRGEDAVQHPRRLYQLKDGSWDLARLAAAGYAWEEPASPALTLEQAKAHKTLDLRDAAEAFLAPFRAEYGPSEMATWDIQAAEADALEADPHAPAPLLGAIAAARGMAVGELAARVRANRNAWLLLAGHVTGQRLALQDQVDAAGTVEAVQAVQPAFTLPGA